MARPDSLDLPTRAVAAAGSGELTRAEVAQHFDISEAALYHSLPQKKNDQTLESLPHAGGREPSLDEEGMRHLQALVEEQNDRTLDEYRGFLAERTGVQLSRSLVRRALGKVKLPLKKDAACR